MTDHLSSNEAYRLLTDTEEALFIDVRSELEYFLVGHPDSAISVPLYNGINFDLNTNFVSAVDELTPDKQRPIVLICRSGARSLEAKKILTNHGYSNLLNIRKGFEGELDENQKRSAVNGWRFNRLPWVQC